MGTFTKLHNGRQVVKVGGNIATYFVSPEGRVLHAVAGPVGAEQLLTEARWAVEAYRKSLDQTQGLPSTVGRFLLARHRETLAMPGLLPETMFSVTAGDAFYAGLSDSRELSEVLEGIVRPQLTALANALKTSAPSGFADVSSQEMVAAETLGRSRDQWRKVLSNPVNLTPKAVFDEASAAKRGKLELFQKSLSNCREACVVQGKPADEQTLRRIVGSQRGTVHSILASYAFRPVDEIAPMVWEGILGEKFSDQPVQVVHSENLCG